MKLKRELFTDPGFMQAIGAIISCRGDIINKRGIRVGCGLSGKEKDNLRKLHKALKMEMDDFNEVVKELRESHGGVYDEEEDIWEYKTPEMKKKANKAIKDYEEEEFKIDRPIIAYNEYLVDAINSMEMGALRENKIMDFSPLDDKKKKDDPEDDGDADSDDEPSGSTKKKDKKQKRKRNN